MLPKETIEKIATLTKIPVDQLTTAIVATEEVPVAIPPTLKSYEDAEISTLSTNKYNEGKLAGVEMDVKAARVTHGLDFQGKSIDNLLAAYGEKVKKEAGIPKDQQLTELNNRITTLTTVNTDLSTKLTQREEAFTGLTLDAEVVAGMPPVKAEVKMTQNDVLTFMKMKGYSFKKEDNLVKTYLNGQLVVDKLGSPLPVKDATTGFMTEVNLIGEAAPIIPRGRGDHDKHVVITGTAKTMTELKEQFKAAGKSLQGAEFMAAAETAAKDKNFDAYK